MKHIGIDARFFTDKATGIGKHVYELVEHLANIDHVNQYTVFLRAEQYDRFEMPGENFHAEIADYPHYSLSEQTHFCRQLHRHKFDLMVFPHFNAPMGYRGKFVVTIHDLTLHHYPGKKKNRLHHRVAYKLLIRTITHRAAHCFAVSENTKQDMIELLQLKSADITVTHNGVSRNFYPLDKHHLKLWEKAKKQYDLPEQYFLYTGVMRSHKNILGLIQAYALFKQNNKDLNVRLVLAGPKDPIYLEELIEQALKLGLTVFDEEAETDRDNESDIYFPGFIESEDMQVVIGSAAGFVFPSFYEGFGIPPLEAMQCGVPVVCSNSSSLPEVCGEAALYFDPNNIESMAYEMEKVIRDKDLRNSLIEAGLIQCEKFKWEDMVEKMYTVYKQLLV